MKKRVKIPKNPEQVVALAKRVKEKHAADGDASALKILNWQMLSPLIDEATLLQQKTDQLKRDLLESYQKRDQKMDSVARFLRNSRDILAGIHDSEMKALGQWGYDVLEVRVKTDSQQLVKEPGRIAQHSV